MWILDGMIRDSIVYSPPLTTVLYLDAPQRTADLARNVLIHLHIHPDLLAVKLAPQVELMAVTVALSWALIFIVLALMRVPMLRAVVQSEGASPRISNCASRQTAINPELQTFRGADLDLVVGIGSCPCTDVCPVPVFTHRLGRYRVVDEVDLVLVGACARTESIRS
jgi:hypothetical protein